MLKRLRAKHPIGFCVLSEVLFLGSLLLASYLIVFALVLFGVDLERVDSYFLSAVQEAVGMVVALVILGRTGKMYLLRRRGSGFFNGLLVGMYPLVLIGYSLYTKLMFGMPEDGQLQPAFINCRRVAVRRERNSGFAINAFTPTALASSSISLKSKEVRMMIVTSSPTRSRIFLAKIPDKKSSHNLHP